MGVELGYNIKNTKSILKYVNERTDFVKDEISSTKKPRFLEAFFIRIYVLKS